MNGFPRFPPALQGQTADEAETPALPLANGLEFGGGSDDFSHDARLS